MRLLVKGKKEVLRMEEKKSGSKRTSRKRGRSSERRASASSSREDAKKISLKRSEIEEAVSDINTLMKQAKIRPHFKNGKPDGLTLTRVKRNSIFTKLGLRSGDILTGIDGNDIESVDDALKFYNSLKSASNVDVEVKRRGRMQHINYSIDDE